MTTEACLAHAQRGLEHQLGAQARDAWGCVCAQYPRRAFTPEFRDGFLDGYADYLDRGGDGQPPAVPPVKFAAKKKYFSPEGQCLARDYLLGFKYGTDVAITSGKRDYLTVPVLQPDRTPVLAVPPGAFSAPVGGPVAPTVPYKTGPQPQPRPSPGAEPPPMPAPAPLPAPRPTSPNPGVPKFGYPDPAPVPPAPVAPEVPPAPAPVLPPGGTKFAPLPVPADPDLLPVPVPPLPEFAPPAPPPAKRPGMPLMLFPPPPPEVPELPPGVRAPTVLDNPPVIPFRLDAAVVPIGAVVPAPPK